MQVRAAARRLPWLIPLFVGCGDDGVAGGGGKASTTGDEAGATMTTATTSGVDTSGVDTTGVDTTGVDTTGVDTTGVDTSGDDTTGVDTTGGVNGPPQAVETGTGWMTSSPPPTAFRIRAGAMWFSGTSLSDAGDVNGDGMDDILVGAYGADPNGPVSGRSYVVFGVPTVAP